MFKRIYAAVGGEVLLGQKCVLWIAFLYRKVLWATLGSCSCFVLWRLVIEQKCMATIVLYNSNVLSVKYRFTAVIEVISLISEFVG